MFQMAPRKADWRLEMRALLADDRASCLWHALVEICTHAQMDQLLTYGRDHEGLSRGWCTREVDAMFAATGINMSVWIAALGPQDKIAPLQVRFGQGQKGVAFVLHTDKGRPEPHWLPVRNVNPRVRIRATPQEVQDYRALGFRAQGPDWTEVMRDVIDVDERLRDQPWRVDLAVPRPDEVQILELGDITILEGVNAIVGVHPPPTLQPDNIPVVHDLNDALEVLRRMLFGIKYYQIGNARLLEVDADYAKGFPNAFERWIRCGRTMWEFHPDVLQECKPEPDDLFYIKDDMAKHPLKPDQHANGCYRIEATRRIRTNDYCFELVDLLHLRSEQGSFKVYSLDVVSQNLWSRSHSLLTLGLTTICRWRTSGCEPVFRRELEDYKVDLADFGGCRKTYLQAFFTIIAQHLNKTEEGKKMMGTLNTVRQNMLAKEAEGELPRDYNPLNTLAAICSMDSQLERLLSIPGMARE